MDNWWSADRHQQVLSISLQGIFQSIVQHDLVWPERVSCRRCPGALSLAFCTRVMQAIGYSDFLSKNGSSSNVQLTVVKVVLQVVLCDAPRAPGSAAAKYMVPQGNSVDSTSGTTVAVGSRREHNCVCSSWVLKSDFITLPIRFFLGVNHLVDAL